MTTRMSSSSTRESEELPLGSMSRATLLTADGQIESLKILGVVEEFSIPVKVKAISEVKSALKDTHYHQPPLLLFSGKKIELFWNMIFVFDRELWGSALQLENHQARNKLFELIEQLDHEIFPAHSVKATKEKPGTSPLSSGYMFSRLFQWCFKTEKQRREIQAEALYKSYGNPMNISSPSSQISELLEQSSRLPELHQRIVRGALRKVVDVG